MKSLLDLLPKGGRSLVDSLQNETKFLRRILFLIQEAEEGISHFLKGELSHFDPHVGDTACQIRAYYFALLWSKREEVFPSLERDLSQLKKYAENLMILMDQGARNLHRDLRPSFLDVFLEKVSLDLSMSEIGLVLINAHILSKYRWVDEEGISQKIDKLKIRREMREARTFVDDLVRHLQMELSWISIQMVLDWLKDLELLKDEDLWSQPSVMETLLYQGDDGRWALPSFGTLEIILKHARKISHLPLFFSLTVISESEEFCASQWIQEIKNHWEFIESPTPEKYSCLVIQAVSLNTSLISNSEYLGFVMERLSDIGVETVLLWVNADHPQYSGLKLKDSCEHPVRRTHESQFSEDMKRYQKQYENYKEMARSFGCSLAFPKFLYSYHFYPSQVSNLKVQKIVLNKFLYRFFKKELIPFFSF